MGIPIPTRVWWTRHEGRLVAHHKEHRIEVPSSEPPCIAGLPEHLAELDFWTPARGQLRVSADKSRELRPEECAAMLKWCDETLIPAAQRLVGRA